MFDGAINQLLFYSILFYSLPLSTPELNITNRRQKSQRGPIWLGQVRKRAKSARLDSNSHTTTIGAAFTFALGSLLHSVPDYETKGLHFNSNVQFHFSFLFCTSTNKSSSSPTGTTLGSIWTTSPAKTSARRTQLWHFCSARAAHSPNDHLARWLFPPTFTESVARREAPRLPPLCEFISWRGASFFN